MIKNAAFVQLLKISNFRSFWFLQVFTLLAMQFYFISLSWITLDVTDSTMILGGLLTITAVPRLILVPLGGVLFDRISPKKLLITNISILVGSTTIFTILLFFLPIHTWMLVLFSIFFGISSALFLPTSFALIPKLVPNDYLQPANSFSQLSMQLSNTFGPALAGTLISAFGVPTVYATMTLFFSISLLCSFLLTNLSPQKNDENTLHDSKLSLINLTKDVVDGFKIINKNKLLLMLVVISALLNLSIIGPQQIGLPYIAKQIPDGGAEHLGFLMSSLGLGTLIGVFIIGFFKDLKSKGISTMVIAIFLGVFWSFVGFTPEYLYITSLFLFLSGICVGMLNVLSVTLIQVHAPPQALGRVMSLQLLGSTGIQPITFLAVGWLLGIISPALLFLYCGIILVATAGISLMFREIRNPSSENTMVNEVEVNEDVTIITVLNELEDIKDNVDNSAYDQKVAAAIKTCQETVASSYFGKEYDWKQHIKC
ncbi:MULTISPECIES: MFS transporter [Pontibacillus]|uniref:MFS transporter n=1 Tax=Pontibacillus chungwhensis TaxID=265426 RepID=A0ABY8UST9_9BACI|nr:MULTISPECIES: MFS transporter [Pontibacillus]MCD5323356.1 MFS transporter [Pontibacillus sp. HN14]WIF96737.1 MFS transporter [Pontibacillus chungwhensis]